MNIPSNISKEHLLEAISKIDQEGIPDYAQSSYYDVVFNDLAYPPKLIVSYANLFANGEILDRNSFEGGLNTPCFKLLEKNGFVIQLKANQKKPQPKFWFVAQGKSYSEDRGMMFLWAPAKGANDRTHFYWDNVLKVKKGDIIFNYSDGLRGISIATSDGYKANNSYPKSTWDLEGYKVDLVTTPLNPIITGAQLVDNKTKLDFFLSSINNKPFNFKGGVNQGYLFEFTKEAGRFLRDIYGNNLFGNKIIDDLFDNVILDNPSLPNKKIPMVLNQKYKREIGAIKTKPFIILAGLSGTGKSRLVRTLAYQFNNIESDRLKRINPPTNFQLIKVKPNWYDSSDLLGYESRISGKDRFIATDFIRFIVKAWQYPETPFFLCLDEMNLAPVEQYFAEYLSVIETRVVSKDGIINTDALLNRSLIIKYANKADGVDPAYDLWKEIELDNPEIQKELKDKGLGLPSNLIVMGTVNMDETTHSFSRKVLDRAMTFEMNDINLLEGLNNPVKDWDYSELPLQKELVISVKTEGSEVFNVLGESGPRIISYLNSINEKLEGSPFKIAYRVRDEFLLFAS